MCKQDRILRTLLAQACREICPDNWQHWLAAMPTGKSTIGQSRCISKQSHCPPREDTRGGLLICTESKEKFQMQCYSSKNWSTMKKRHTYPRMTIHCIGWD